MSSIPLSNEKISFTASLQEGWSGGQGSGDKSRAVKPDFPGLAREQKVLTTDEAFSKPLYLHPIETVNKTQKNQGPTTRGTMSSKVGDFGVSANYIQNGSSAESTGQSLFHNKEAKKEGSNWFVADYEEYEKWPTAGKVSFYAYAPYNDPSFTLNDNNKTIHYKVPTDVEKQPDFIVANSEDKSFTSSSVDLKFSHALTAITFSVSDDMEKGVINSIKIEGVKGEGDYDLSSNKSDNKWDFSNSTAAGPYTVSFAGNEGKVEGNNRALTGGVTNDNKVLMMIPQKLGSGAKVTINFTPTGQGEKEASFSLDSTTWAAGNHITYVLSTTKMLNLSMGTITYPKGWNSVNTNADTDKQIKASYANGDSIGMYIVDKYNKVIEANLKFTYNDSQWTVESGKEFQGSPQYNYFVYYPYQLGGLPGAPAKDASNIDVTSAEKFFANAITEWGKKFDTSSGNTIDQSDIKKMNSFDLQIGKADVLGESGTAINFASMTHAMGLAEIVLGKKRFTDCICYLVGYEEYPTWKGTTTSYASSSIKNHTMYGIADHRYVSIVKPGENSFISTTVKDAWQEEVKLSPAANEVKSGTAYSSFNPTTPHAYTLAVGDIYYSDGAIAHQEDYPISTSGRIPIGIVGYTTMNGDGNYWTEKNTKKKRIGGHALVMCLKTIGSTGSTKAAQEDYKNNGNNGAKVKAYIGTLYAWYSSNSDAGRKKYDEDKTRKSMLINSYNETYGSGYRETAALIGVSAAAAAAENYKMLPAKSTKCTGWFLPTAGQYYAVITSLGAAFSSDWTWTGIWDGNTSTHPKYGFFYNMKTNAYNITDNINDKLKKVGDTNYTEFFGSVNTWAWTSSEFSSTNAVRIDSGVYNSKGSGSVRFGRSYSGKTSQNPVRPFLAF